MSTKIFVNLPVRDLNTTVEFFTKIGFSFDKKFTDENATCMIIDDNIFVMLLVEKFFKSFIKKEISDSSKTTEVILAFTAGSRQDVDDMMNRVFNAGGKEHKKPEDHGWMYSRCFEDLDGHLWEVFFMDESTMPLD